MAPWRSFAGPLLVKLFAPSTVPLKSPEMSPFERLKVTFFTSPLFTAVTNWL